MRRPGLQGQVLWLQNLFTITWAKLVADRGLRFWRDWWLDTSAPLTLLTAVFQHGLASSGTAKIGFIHPPSLTKWKLIFNYSPKWKSMALLATPSNVCAINLSSRPARGSSSFSHLASGPPACREEGQLSTSTGFWAQLPSSGEAAIRSIWAPLR